MAGSEYPLGELTNRVVESFCQGGNPTVGAGDIGISSAAVPTGKRWVVTSIACFNLQTINTNVQIYVHDGTGFRILKSQASPAACQSTDWQGVLVMEAGWYIRFVLNGCALNDTIYWGITYYKIKD